MTADDGEPSRLTGNAAIRDRLPEDRVFAILVDAETRAAPVAAQVHRAGTILPRKVDGGDVCQPRDGQPVRFMLSIDCTAARFVSRVATEWSPP